MIDDSLNSESRAEFTVKYKLWVIALYDLWLTTVNYLYWLTDFDWIGILVDLFRLAYSNAASAMMRSVYHVT